VPERHLFHTGAALALGLKELCRHLEEQLSLHSPVNVHLSGGMAVHIYRARRVTADVDAELGSRIFIPGDLIVDVMPEDGTHQTRPDVLVGCYTANGNAA